MNMKKMLFLPILLSVCCIANATDYTLTTNVEQVGTMKSRYGVCFAKLTDSFSAQNLACNDWVTFSCDGKFNSKEDAARMFDQAQMAFALDKQVQVTVRHYTRQNGYCAVRRIDVL